MNKLQKKKKETLVLWDEVKLKLKPKPKLKLKQNKMKRTNSHEVYKT